MTGETEKLRARIAKLEEACRLGVIYDDMLRGYAGPISQYGALLGGEMPNIDAAYDAWATAARRAVGAPVLPLPEGAPGA